MPALKNPRRELFARKYLETGIGAEAYRLAYPGIEPDYAAKACAARLLTYASLQQRIAEMQTAMATRAEVTEDSLLTELEEARALAIKCEQSAAAVSATVAKAKLTGLMIERRESGKPGDFEGWTQEELAHYVATGIEPGAMPAISDSAGHGAEGAPALPDPTHGGSNSTQ